MRPTNTDESLKYQFTPSELLHLSQQMAAERNQSLLWQQRKAEANAFFKDAIDAHEAEVTRLSKLVNNGFEYRWVGCVVHYNDPAVGEKSIYRTDTGELLRALPMSHSERQEESPVGQVMEQVEFTLTSTPPIIDGKTASTAN